MGSNFLGYSIIELMMYFSVYSVLGWLGEVIYHSVKKGHYVKRGFMEGYFCPLYGTIMLIGILVLPTLLDELASLFIGAFVIVMVVEFLTAFSVDLFFSKRIWDYSGRFLNIHGYTCFFHSLKMSFAMVIALVFIQPLLYGLVYAAPSWLKFILLIVFYSQLVPAWIDALADAGIEAHKVRTDKDFKKNLDNPKK